MEFEEKQEWYRKAAEGAGLQVKGKAGYTSLNGHMFSFVGKDGTVAFRLSPEDKDAFEEKYQTGDVIQYNAVMRGYVPVSDEMLQDTELCISYLKAGHAYIGTLKPKPTTKKK